MCWNSNPAKTHGLPTEITTWFQDLMKLRSSMSHHGKNSVRHKVTGKKWIYLERNTLHRQSVGHLGRREQSHGVVWSAFMGWVIS